MLQYFICKDKVIILIVVLHLRIKYQSKLTKMDCWNYSNFILL